MLHMFAYRDAQLKGVGKELEVLFSGVHGERDGGAAALDELEVCIAAEAVL